MVFFVFILFGHKMVNIINIYQFPSSLTVFIFNPVFDYMGFVLFFSQCIKCSLNISNCDICSNSINVKKDRQKCIHVIIFQDRVFCPIFNSQDGIATSSFKSLKNILHISNLLELKFTLSKIQGIFQNFSSPKKTIHFRIFYIIK